MIGWQATWLSELSLVSRAGRRSGNHEEIEEEENLLMMGLVG